MIQIGNHRENGNFEGKGVEGTDRAGVKAHFKPILPNFVFISKWIKAAILYSINLDFYKKNVLVSV